MANSEKTLVLVKPDGVSEGHIGEVITRLERKGYQIAALKGHGGYRPTGS